MIEDRQIEFLLFSREIIGSHALGDQVTEIRPITGDKVFQFLKSYEFMLIRIGSSGIGFRDNL
jgi:hypothetical protein